ncbi:MAG TPA: response regulator [Acidobacteriota bacterium]|nr:response regulator [Acidobacteriota bacterium]
MRKQSILVIEDNALIVKFYRMALERQGGYEVHATENVEEILRLVGSGAVDLVILDISLSNAHYHDKKVDGIDIAALIRQNPASAQIPILVATAHAMEGDRKKIVAATGANDYLEKPIYDSKKLIAKVQGLLSGEK